MGVRLALLVSMILAGCGRVHFALLPESDASSDADRDSGEEPADAASDAMNDASGAMSDASDAMSDATDAMNDATDAMSDATDAMNDATDAMSDASDAMSDATDAMSDATDAMSDVGACVPESERCNVLDDDCDGRIDEGFVRVAIPAGCSAPPRAGTFVAAGMSWDQADSPTRATLTGALEVGAIRAKASWAAGLPGFAFDHAIANLLGLGASDGAYFAVFPNSDGAPPEPNVVRTTVELDWEGWVLVNEAGPDLVVYEIATPEPLLITIRRRDGTLTAPRYRVAGAYDGALDVNETHVDLDDFGVAPFEAVQAILVSNVFNEDAAGGGDRVDDPSGEGRVVAPGEAGYDTAFPLLDGSGMAFTTSTLDTDALYVGALHAIREPLCCVSP